MQKIAQYVLSAYSFISDPLDKILDVGNQSKIGNPIPSFDEHLLINLCAEAQEIFKKEKNVLEIKGNFIIVGDIHGSFHDLLRILNFIQQNNSKVLFLGDYVDRGNFSLECITILFALKIIQPDNFFLLRGNHEFDSLCSQYGFKDEILNFHDPKKPKNSSNQQINVDDSDFTSPQYEDEYYPNHNDIGCYKYSETLYDAFVKTFAYLPIAAIVNNKTFCIHGGISPRLENIKSLNKSIVRPINSFEESTLFADVVWSDPSENFESMFEENPRGRGYLFNEYSLIKFLSDNSLDKIIRAHQCVLNGSLVQFDDKCITVFSASSYTQPLGNCSGILQLFEKDNSITITTFPPLYRLLKSEATYYKVESLTPRDAQIRNYFSILHPKLLSNATVKIVAKHRGNKIIGHSSDSSLQSHGTPLKRSNVMRPKLVTNQKKSCQNALKSAIYQTGSLPTLNNDNNNANNQINGNKNDPNYLTRSFSSLLDV